MIIVQPKALFIRHPQRAMAASRSISMRKSMPTLQTSPLLETGMDWTEKEAKVWGEEERRNWQMKKRSQGMGRLEGKGRKEMMKEPGGGG
jgi:hypothetical protein